ncbi:MAG TPA: AraC family transcriptional regulator, partial [Gammaproteobacteria bacterium]|nr:AraC family transcriptional regulator [Gammaproteobacteria bacterium]
MTEAAASRIFARFDDGRMLYMPETPLLMGGRSGSFIFERRHIPAPGKIPAHTFDEHVFMLPVGDEAVRFSSRLNGRNLKGLVEPWRFRFLAAGDTLSTTWDTPIEAIFMTLNPELLPLSLGEEALARPVDLASNIMPHEDLLLAQLSLAMQYHIRGGRRAGLVFEQSLLAAVAAHLFAAYGTGKRGKIRNSPLTRRNRARIEDYVRQNLGRDIGLAEIAAVVGISPRQLSRAFRAATGQSLWQFVIECRVREATRMLARNRNLSL